MKIISKKTKIILTILSLILFSKVSIAQSQFDLTNNREGYLSIGLGAQMSGIKKMDFIPRNFSPSFVIEGGRWMSSLVALEAGFKGLYYKCISDYDKHYYGFLYGNLKLNAIRLFNTSYFNDANIYPYIGAGLMYNHYGILPTSFGILDYNRGRMMIAANLGVLFTYTISDHFYLGIDVSSISGWQIYQGNEDIIPQALIRIGYSFSCIKNKFE